MWDPKLVPQVAKRKKKKKIGQSKAADMGLEGFMDWTNPGVNELAEEEEEVEMSCLFLILMRGCLSEWLALKG